MPHYQVEIDGRRFIVEGDHPPSEAEARAAVGNHLSGALPTKPVGTEDFLPPQPEGSALGRFASGVADELNPIALAKGAYNALVHPIATGSALAKAQYDQGVKAVDMAHQGRISEALGHAGAAVLPLLGPAAAEAGEQIGSGDIAGGLGKTAGLLAPFAAAPIARGVSAAAPTALKASIADSLAAKAASNVVDVMAPKVGANKARFGALAQKVAPEIAANPEMGAWSREGLHAKIQTGLADAEQALDSAQDARLSARTFSTEPILNDLRAKRQALTAQAVEGSQVPRSGAQRESAILNANGGKITVTDLKREALGSDVVPTPNQPRVAQIDQAIAEIQRLGPVARYGDLRTIRAAYDGPAKAVYAPSITADYLKAQGGKLGAADVTGVLRDKLAAMDPRTAQANAQYSLYRTADDVMQAAAEVERTRPKIGRKIMARFAGASVGAEAAGIPGAIAGHLLGPLLDGIAQSGWTTQAQSAQIMSRLARALRAGDEGGIASSTHLLQRLAAQAMTLTGSVTSPTESQIAPAGAGQ